MHMCKVCRGHRVIKRGAQYVLCPGCWPRINVDKRIKELVRGY